MAIIECPRCSKDVNVLDVWAAEQEQLPSEQWELILCDECETELEA